MILQTFESLMDSLDNQPFKAGKFEIYQELVDTLKILGKNDLADKYLEKAYSETAVGS